MINFNGTIVSQDANILTQNRAFLYGDGVFETVKIINNKILFLEDVGEHEYSIDRMLRMLKRADKLANLNGLIIGAFNEIEAEQIPFGQTADEVIWDIVKEYDYPVCFNFPTGHIDNNLSMVLGAAVSLKIEINNVQFKYL